MDILSLIRSRSTVFSNREFLNNDFVPSNIVGREQQVIEVAQIFRSVFVDAYPSAPSNTLIYGKVGVGKTLVLFSVLKELSPPLNEHGYIIVYLRCELSKITKILNEIINEIDPKARLPKTGISIGTYLQKIYDLLNEKNKRLILILDEVDKLDNLEILYSFSRTGEGNRKLRNGLHISLILITNDLSFKEKLETRIESSLSASDIVFPVYTPRELIAILNDRLDAFQEGSVSPSILMYVAGLSAHDYGDARKAIQLLRISGDVADKRGSPIVEEIDVEQGFTLMTASQKVEGLKNFNVKLQLTALSVILVMSESGTAGPIITRDAYKKYLQLCEMNVLKSISITRFASYITELDMHNVLDTRIVYCGRAGKQRNISILLSQDEMADIVNFLTKKYELILSHPVRLPN